MEKRIILMGVPYHKNLGDNAIVVAEEKFIKDLFPNYIYNYVPEENMLRCVEIVKNYIDDDDILVMHGGGNMGNEYSYIEQSRRRIVELFPNNKIIVMPQTIFFSDDENGREEFEASKKIYNSHKNLTIIAREKISYELMKKNFKCNVVFTPDIVLYLNEIDNDNTTRNGALFLIRHDEESIFSDEQRNGMFDYIKKRFNGNVVISDTMHDRYLRDDERRIVFNKKLDQIRDKEIVITDRLHGMIFSVITGTPCVVLGNYNHKIRESAKWFRDFNYVKYVDDIKNVPNAVEELIKIEKIIYNDEEIRKNILKIKELIEK